MFEHRFVICAQYVYVCVCDVCQRHHFSRIGNAGTLPVRLLLLSFKGFLFAGGSALMECDRE